tara:strand:+ start:891 stop:1625 length:735 start_codon:yes stop_codon:yes gene_type:complete
MSENFNDILNEVKGLKKNLTFFSRANNLDLEISPLNLQQQKIIIENSIQSNLSVLFFNNSFYNIIKENFAGDINTLDTIDRVSISLSLRQKMSNEYALDDTKVDISNIIDKNKTHLSIDPLEIVTDSFTFRVSKPSLVLDNKVNKLLLNKYKGKKITEDNVNNVISDLYVYEILKFVDEIIVGDKTLVISENFNNSLKILSEIETSELKEIFNYINKIRDIELNMTQIPNSEKYISITPDFFVV